MNLKLTHHALLCAIMTFLAFFIGEGDLYSKFLDNTTFDTDVSGWNPAVDSTLAWDPLDSQASPTSGSALVTNLSSTKVDSTGSNQCTDGILGASKYSVSAGVYIPSGQTESGLANIVVLWFAELGCSSLLDLAISSNVLTSTPDLWLPVSGWLTAPDGSQSPIIRLSVLKVEDTGSLAAHFDNVSFAEGIFTDGFESGDVSAWSDSTFCPRCPVADFDFFVNGLTVTFLNTSTGDPVLNYVWAFGDGTPVSTQQNPQHTYSSPATYLVVLTVSNSLGSDSIMKPVTVSP